MVATLPLFAQSANPAWQLSDADAGQSTVVDVRDDGSYLVYAEEGKKSVLRDYGPDHRLRRESTNKYRADGDAFLPEVFLATRSQRFAVGYSYDRRGDRTMIYAGEVGPRGITGIRRRYTLTGPVGDAPAGQVEITATADRQSILLADTRRTEGDVLTVSVFDSNFVYRWRQSVPLPDGTAVAGIRQTLLANSGTVFALATAGNELQVLALTEQDQLTRTLQLGSGHAVSDARLILTDDARQPVALSGLYTQSGVPAGVFHLRLSADLTVLSTSRTPFHATASCDGATGTIDNAVVLPDGTVWTFLGNHRQDEASAADPANGTDCDLLVFRHDRNGDLIGQFTLPRTLRPGNVATAYNVFVRDNRVYVRFAERLDPAADPGASADTKLMQHTLITLNFEGEILDRQPLSYFKPKARTAAFASSTYVVEASVLFMLESRRASRFATLRIPEVSFANN